jgi:GNAT superfamily N-acetyltransferase
MKQQVLISADKSKLDISFIHAYLSGESYWAKGRSREEVIRSIENSICFGAYLPDGRQIAFARVITDRLVFAWLMDVFVTPGERGKGVGKLLISELLKHEALQQVKGIGLRTEDAHGLYRSYGFGEIPKMETWMFRPNQKPE